MLCYSLVAIEFNKITISLNIIKVWCLKHRYGVVIMSKEREGNDDIVTEKLEHKDHETVDPKKSNQQDIRKSQMHLEYLASQIKGEDNGQEILEKLYEEVETMESELGKGLNFYNSLVNVFNLGIQSSKREKNPNHANFKLLLLMEEVFELTEAFFSHKPNYSDKINDYKRSISTIYKDLDPEDSQKILIGDLYPDYIDE